MPIFRHALSPLLWAPLFAVSLAAPASAHHSHAMFDTTRSIVLEGTVKKFEWTNPHSWLQVLVTDAAGQTKEWALELGSPAQLSRAGWRPRTVATGDRVSVTVHPLKDGNPGGAVFQVTLPDGKTIGGEND